MFTKLLNVELLLTDLGMEKQCCLDAQSNFATCISIHEGDKCLSYSRTVNIMNRKCELGK